MCFCGYDAQATLGITAQVANLPHPVCHPLLLWPPRAPSPPPRGHHVGSFVGMLSEEVTVRKWVGAAAVSLSPQAQLRLGPVQSHSDTSWHSNHTLGSVSKSQSGCPRRPLAC